MSLGDVFKMGADDYGDKVNIVFAGKEYTFKEMYGLTIRFANALLKLGVQQSDVVAIWLPNCPFNLQVTKDSAFNTVNIKKLNILKNE